MKEISTRITLFLAMLCFTACVKEDEYSNTATGNFDALWNIIDSRYCFFDYAESEFGLDWDAVYDKYRPRDEEQMTQAALFDLLGEMLRELRDGHVNLTSEYGTSYYWDWQLLHPVNFSDSIQRNYLGTRFKLNNGIKYTILPEDSVAYAYVPTFQNNFGDSNISTMLLSVSKARGLIIDIRNNGGGMLTAAEQLASHFTNEKIHSGYIQHKTGTGHYDFSQPKPIYLERGDGVIWMKPVVILTNRSVYSSANHFIMLMRPLPHVITLGDKTGGGSGMPLNSTLPNGWRVRFSACPILDRNGMHTEFGIEPDTLVHMTSDDWNSGRDTMIESARMLINRYYDNLDKE